MKTAFVFLGLLFFGVVAQLWPQDAQPAPAPSVQAPAAQTPAVNPAPGGQNAAAAAVISSYIGLQLDDLITQFGPPESVYSSRGQELWQDDVVFVYLEGDFYIFKDRVWQVKIKNAYGVSVGDPKAAAILALGDEAEDQGDFILLPLPPAGWPITLRMNFNAAGKVSGIFIYRPDL
ncbi:MAG: hypothetical protein FWF29_01485 [Treponema sp.]|nr:hypothetical protein [Treponema sp.]